MTTIPLLSHFCLSEYITTENVYVFYLEVTWRTRRAPSFYTAPTNGNSAQGT